jgi:hypothetical protein
MVNLLMTEYFCERYPPPRHVDELSGGYRVVSSNGFTLAWIYSADGVARSADPQKLTHAEALAMAKAMAALASERPRIEAS